jgi:hypothetical protein
MYPLKSGASGLDTITILPEMLCMTATYEAQVLLPNWIAKSFSRGQRSDSFEGSPEARHGVGTLVEVQTAERCG